MIRFPRKCRPVVVGLSILLWTLLLPFLTVSLPASDGVEGSSGAHRGGNRSQAARVVTLPVGHGDAHVVFDSAGRASVVDAGSTTAVVTLIDFLKCNRVRRIHTLVLTHPQWDHIGGASDLIRRFDVGEIWRPNLKHETELNRALKRTINRHSVTVRGMKRGYTGRLLPSVRARVLTPGPNTSGGLNPRSLAFSFRLGETRFLMMGDVVGRGESELLNSGFLGPADVVKIAHHGDAEGTSRAFLTQVKPRVAIIPAPRRQDDPWGYPNRELIRRLEDFDVRWYQTGRHGFIEVQPRVNSSDPPNIKIRTSHKPFCKN